MQQLISVLLWQGGLPYVLQKRDKIETIEKTFNQEIATLKQNQENLKKEISINETRRDQANQEQLNQLQLRILQLEKSLQELQQKSLTPPQPSP